MSKTVTKEEHAESVAQTEVIVTKYGLLFSIAYPARLAMNDPYALAQRAMADLKAAVYPIIKAGPPEGMRNADIGRTLGIHVGHFRHEGHIPRTLLAIMEGEDVVQQDPQTKLWTIRIHRAGEVIDEPT